MDMNQLCLRVLTFVLLLMVKIDTALDSVERTKMMDDEPDCWVR